jgi:hypothetical protein
MSFSKVPKRSLTEVRDLRVHVTSPRLPLSLGMAMDGSHFPGTGFDPSISMTFRGWPHGLSSQFPQFPGDRCSESFRGKKIGSPLPQRLRDKGHVLSNLTQVDPFWEMSLWRVLGPMWPKVVAIFALCQHYHCTVFCTEIKVFT